MRRTLAVCCAPQVLIAMDFSLVTVSAPDLARDLRLTGAELAAVFSAYSLTFGSLLLVCGRAADRFDRRRLLRLGLAGFATAAGLNAAAVSGAMLVASRVLQGAAAAVMTPAALSLLSSGFEAPAARRRALAAYGVAISAGFVTGALAAGAMATLGSWRVAVGLSAPVAAAALGLAFAGHGGARRSDVALAGPGAARRSVALACGAAAIVTATGVAATLLVTVHLQADRGRAPLETAGVLSLFGTTALAGGRLAERGAARLAPPDVLAAGLAVQGAAILVLGLEPAAGALGLLGAGMAAFGLGHVVANAGAAMSAVAHVPARAHGLVSGMLATAQYLGATVGPLALAGPAGRGGFHAGMTAAGSVAVLGAALVVLGRWVRPRSRRPRSSRASRARARRTPRPG